MGPHPYCLRSSETAGDSCALALTPVPSGVLTCFVLIENPFFPDWMSFETTILSNAEPSRNYVMIVIPKPDDWVRAIVLVTQGAQAGRAQKQIPPR